MEDLMNNTNFHSSCHIGNTSLIFQVVTLSVACIGLPLTLVAIISVFLQIQNDNVVPVYVINLLICDLIQFCCMLARAEVSGVKICELLLYIFEFGIMVSINFMVVISLERYLVVAHPLWYKFRRSIRISVVVCVTVWILPVIYLPIFFFAADNAETVVAGFLLLPFPLVLFFLVGTIRALSAAQGVPDDEKRRILAILVTVLLIYTLLFLPRIIYSFAKSSRDDFMFGIMTVMPVYFSPLTDIALYIFIRKGVADTLLIFLCCSKLNSDDVSSTRERENTHVSLELEKEEGKNTEEEV